LIKKRGDLAGNADNGHNGIMPGKTKDRGGTRVIVSVLKNKLNYEAYVRNLHTFSAYNCLNRDGSPYQYDTALTGNDNCGWLVGTSTGSTSMYSSNYPLEQDYQFINTAQYTDNIYAYNITNYDYLPSTPNRALRNNNNEIYVDDFQEITRNGYGNNWDKQNPDSNTYRPQFSASFRNMDDTIWQGTNGNPVIGENGYLGWKSRTGQPSLCYTRSVVPLK
jgi:hypothetical protein